MNDLLMLTGTCGVGKSTIAKAWALSRRGVAISGDQIRLWMRVREIRRAEDYQHDLVTNIAIDAASRFIAKQMDVALDFVWRPNGIAMVRSAMQDMARVQAVQLVCEPAENSRRDQLRSGNDVMGPRVAELEQELAQLDWPADVHRIDSTNLTVEQTLARVERTFESM